MAHHYDEGPLPRKEKLETFEDIFDDMRAAKLNAAFNCSRLGNGVIPWQDVVSHGIKLFLEQTALKHNTIDPSHTQDTPDRFVKALTEYASGCDKDPRVHLTKRFATGNYNQMILVSEIRFVSMCAHHLAPIFGKADFAYIPGEYIVGLSKIPRFIEELAKRPQVQENISEEIVGIFEEVVKPKGCAVVVRAYHGCMQFRGIEEHASVTRTNALRGSFETDPITRSEFFSSISQSPVFP